MLSLDFAIYGLCPARDEFYLVICEICGVLVKPQALQQHTGIILIHLIAVIVNLNILVIICDLFYLLFVARYCCVTVFLFCPCMCLGSILLLDTVIDSKIQ